MMSDDVWHCGPVGGKKGRGGVEARTRQDESKTRSRASGQHDMAGKCTGTQVHNTI